jgi:hypothetical protein
VACELIVLASFIIHQKSAISPLRASDRSCWGTAINQERGTAAQRLSLDKKVTLCQKVS